MSTEPSLSERALPTVKSTWDSGEKIRAAIFAGLGASSLHPFCSRERAALGGREASAQRHSRRLGLLGRMSEPLLSVTCDLSESYRYRLERAESPTLRYWKINITHCSTSTSRTPLLSVKFQFSIYRINWNFAFINNKLEDSAVTIVSTLWVKKRIDIVGAEQWPKSKAAVSSCWVHLHLLVGKISSLSAF